MAIYKVRINNDSNTITYKTNSTILATVEYQLKLTNILCQLQQD